MLLVTNAEAKMPTIKTNKHMRNFEKHENSSKRIGTPKKSSKNSQAVIKLNDTRNDRVQYTSTQPKHAHLSNFNI